MKKLTNYRETPLFRARNFEKAIGTTCEIYIKDEGKTPSGNHKMNSAYLIAYLCAKDGIRTIEMFNKEEGIMVALETAYQLAGVVDKARTHHNKAILGNISSTT